MDSVYELQGGGRTQPFNPQLSFQDDLKGGISGISSESEARGDWERDGDSLTSFRWKEAEVVYLLKSLH